MVTTPFNRKLAAIVIADVVGYSRHMELDDTRTHLRLKELREQLIDPAIARHGGHVIRTAGDGMLLEFSSAVAALLAAIEVQRGLGERNRLLAPDDRIEFRFGINVGDVLVDGGEIAGDGVNIAARLESLAAPGGICVSESVREQVHGNIDTGFIDDGKQYVKNIDRPIQVYSVDLERRGGDVAGSGRRAWKNLARAVSARRLAIAVTLAVFGLVALLTWPPSKIWKRAATVAPPALSVAVMPFDASAATPEDSQFAEGISQDLTMALGRTYLVRVVSPSVAASYKGKALDVRAVGRELNVRYLIQGQLNRSGDQVVLTVHFIDADNGMDLWSERKELGPLQSAQARDAVLSRLTASLRDVLSHSEQRRVAALPQTDANAMDLLLQARAAENRDPNTLRSTLAARKLYDQALELDPGSVPAMLGRVRTLIVELDLDPHADHDSLIQETDLVTRRATAIDDSSPSAWVYRAEALWRQWRWEAALEANGKATQLDPTLASPLLQRAFIKLHIGLPVEALALVDQGAALDSRRGGSTGRENLVRCITYMNLDRYRDAIAACEKAVANDDWWQTHLYLTAAYALAGDGAKAEAEKARLGRAQPGFTIADFKALRYSDNPIYWRQTEAHLLSGLRKAGVPEK